MEKKLKNYIFYRRDFGLLFSFFLLFNTEYKKALMWIWKFNKMYTYISNSKQMM